MSETTSEAAIPSAGSSSPFLSTRWTVVLAAAAEPEALDAPDGWISGDLGRRLPW